VVKGRWDYCSGAPYATHALLAVKLMVDGAWTVGCAIVPRAQWVMQDEARTKQKQKQ